jgi:RNA polymerase subunit RPABC4/transcription elongation factor Spt4
VEVGEAPMPMIDCHECGKKISDYADACPKCGAKPKKAELQDDPLWGQRLVQYRCKSCDLLIKQIVDKCPNCNADQTGENQSQSIWYGIIYIIGTIILWQACNAV